MTTIKITELTDIGANLASSTVLPVVNMSGTPTTQKTILGNIANVILGGAGGNYVAVGAATLAGTVTTNAQPNITSTGSLTGLTVSNAASTVNFSNTANVTLGAVGNLHIAGGTAGQLLSTNGNGTLSWASDTTTYGNSNVVSLMAAYGSNTITTTGNVSVGNIIGNGQALTGITGANVGGFVPNANVANTAFAVAGANVSGFVPNANVANTAFAVAAANVSGLGNIATLNLDGNVSNLLTGNGTYVAIPVVPTVGNIATINLTGSNSNVLYGNGVFAAVAGGANTGNVTFSDQVVMGTGGNDGTGGLYLAPGNASIANSAVQYLRVRGGDVVTHIHLDTGNNQFYDQYFGDDNKYVKLELGDAGNVVIGTDDANGNSYNWSFTSDGNLILADGNSVIQSIANSSLDPTLPNVSTMTLTPDQNYNSQALVLDPTAPGHIHLRAPGANIDEPSANIFLGGETSSFEVGYYNGDAPNLFVHSGNNTWTFDNSGNLTFPGNLVIAGNANVFGTNLSLLQTTDNRPLIALSSGANGAVSSLWVEDIGNVGTSNIAAVYANPISGSTIVRIAVGQNGGGGPNLWDFSATGILTLPQGSQISETANTSVNITANANTWAFGVNGNLTLPGNIVTPNGANAVIPSTAGTAGAPLIISAGTGGIAATSLNAGNGGNLTINAGDAGSDIGNPSWGAIGGTLILRGGNSTQPYAGSNVEIRSGNSASIPGAISLYTGANQWTFDATGNLTVPGSLINDTSIVLSAPAIFNICTIASAGSGYNTGSSLKATTGGSGSGMTVGIGYGLSNQLTSVTVVNPGTGYVNGDVITVSEGTGGTFVLTKYNQSANQTNNNTIQTDFTFANSTVTLPIYGEMATDASMTLTTNLANAGNTRSWTFGADGNLTIPGNTVAINFANGSSAFGNIVATNLDGNVSNLLTGNGTYVAIPVVPTVGNIATLNLDGNASNVLRGDGTFGADANSSYGDSNVTSLLGAFGSNTISTTGNITGNTNGFAIGYLNIPQVAAANATLALTDAGKHYYSTTAGNFTLTVPTNANVAFATGTAVSIVVQAAGNILVNAASGVTLYMAGNSTAANRVVGGYGMATLMKVGTDTWFINGTGVS